MSSWDDNKMLLPLIAGTFFPWCTSSLLCVKFSLQNFFCGRFCSSSSSPSGCSTSLVLPRVAGIFVEFCTEAEGWAKISIVILLCQEV